MASAASQKWKLVFLQIHDIVRQADSYRNALQVEGALKNLMLGKTFPLYDDIEDSISQ
jgi:hypothetical protein